MSKRLCIRFKRTEGGRRCAKFAAEGGSNLDHAMVSIPGLSGYGVLNKSVNSTDVMVGGALGAIGAVGVKALVSKVESLNQSLPAPVQNLMPAIGAIVAGTAAYALESKSNKARAYGHLVGAISAGVAIQGWNFLKSQFPALSDVVSVQLGRYGLSVNEQTPRIGPGGMGGLVVDEPGRALGNYADNPGMGELARLSMGEDSSGVEELMD